MTDELTEQEVYDVMSEVSDRDIRSVRSPDGQAIQFHFEVDSYDAHELPVSEGRYALEVNIFGPSIWFHDYDESPTETLWENKSRR